MSAFLDIFRNTYNTFARFFSSSNSDITSVGTKRKRKNSEISENIAPKRLRSSRIQTNINSSKHFRIFTSRAEKMQEMVKLRADYDPSKSHLRLPQSWNINLDACNKNEIEISSDEDDDDVQIISEETVKNRNPLLAIAPAENKGALPKPSGANGGIEVLRTYKKKKDLHQTAVHSGTTSQELVTPTLSSICRKNRFGLSSTMKKDNFKISFPRPRTIQMVMQAKDKATYSALLSRILPLQTNMSTNTSSFENLQDFEKFNRYKPRKKTTSKVEFIDLTKPKENRKAVRIPVKTHECDSDGDDSDIEVLSVRQPVPRVNSFEARTSNHQYTSPDWLKTLNEELQSKHAEINKRVEEEKLKKDAYSKHNQQQINAIEERVRRHMSITDAVIIDEPVEEDVPLPDLTPEMERKIEMALHPRPPNDVVAEGFSLRISRKDMNTLAKLNWLNDEVINFYMNLLIERGKRDKMPKVYAFNTFFYPKLMGQGHASLKRWTRKIDVFAQDLICVPVHLGVHWCMAIIDFREKIVEYYDSMGHANNKCLSALLKYLQEESLDKKNVTYDTSSWKTVNKTDIPQQMNGSDCGMFACTFAEYKCRNAKINFTQDDMPYFRKKMVYEILTGHLMIGNDK